MMIPSAIIIYYSFINKQLQNTTDCSKIAAGGVFYDSVGF